MSSEPSLTLTEKNAGIPRVTLQRARGLLQCGRHNLGGQVEVLAQVFNPFVSQEPAPAVKTVHVSVSGAHLQNGTASQAVAAKHCSKNPAAMNHNIFPNLYSIPVIVAPGEALCDQLLRLEGLHELDHLQIWHFRDLRVCGQVVVFLGIEYALCVK